jgi:hypothetical protein
MEEKSYSVLRRLLPCEWVIHEYKPDYGIDYAVEIFKAAPSDGAPHMLQYETLGETFYVQLKSTSSCAISSMSVVDRFNVEKTPLKRFEDTRSDIQIIKHSIDSSFLQTVESMGVAVPVVLVLVCIDTGRAFFLCVNDYIDKVLTPEVPRWQEQSSCTLRIPILNEITDSPDSLVPLRFFGKRAKFYAAFSRFAYQKEIYEQTDNVAYVRHFIDRLLRYDFWNESSFWAAIDDTYDEILQIDKELKAYTWVEEEGRTMMHVKIYRLWHRLANLNHMFEENCREWFLPTYQGNSSSYPR